MSALRVRVRDEQVLAEAVLQVLEEAGEQVVVGLDGFLPVGGERGDGERRRGGEEPAVGDRERARQVVQDVDAPRVGRDRDRTELGRHEVGRLRVRPHVDHADREAVLGGHQELARRRVGLEADRRVLDLQLGDPRRPAVGEQLLPAGDVGDRVQGLRGRAVLRRPRRRCRPCPTRRRARSCVTDRLRRRRRSRRPGRRCRPSPRRRPRPRSPRPCRSSGGCAGGRSS